MFGGPKYQKLSTNLRLAINRFKLLEKKKTELTLKSRKEIADYLSSGKEDRARIRVEHIIREDYLVEAMEMIEMYCDLLLARMGLIQSTKEVDEGLEEPIASIIWATPRLQAEVSELKVVTDQLTAKYGKEFTQSCHSNELNNVNEKIIHKLGVQAPPKILVEKYLEEIAKSFNVRWAPNTASIEEDEVLKAEGQLIDFNNDRRRSSGMGGMRSPQPAGNASAPFSYPKPAQPGYRPPQDPFAQPPGPAVYNAPAQPNDSFPELPSVPSSSSAAAGESSVGGESVDFDDLTKRFEALKRRK